MDYQKYLVQIIVEYSMDLLDKDYQDLRNVNSLRKSVIDRWSHTRRSFVIACYIKIKQHLDMNTYKADHITFDIARIAWKDHTVT